MKDYEGTCLIGVVGPELEIGECRDSIQAIERRPGDEGPHLVRATKGYEARQHLFDLFEKSQHSFLLLLDHDQTYPPDTLERLRSHKLPYVSGYTLRRSLPVATAWYEYPQKPDTWPMTPWTGDPERGKLHPLGATGWYCILVHREVVEAVKALLKGEPLVIEDDLDVWPYDLNRIMEAVNGIGALLEDMPRPAVLKPALAHHYQALKEEIRPLRCLKSVIGSDLRFPFFARMAGFTLMGDPDVRCGHMLNYPLSPDDYSAQSDDYRQGLEKGAKEGVSREQVIIEAAQKSLAEVGA